MLILGFEFPLALVGPVPFVPIGPLPFPLPDPLPSPLILPLPLPLPVLLPVPVPFPVGTGIEFWLGVWTDWAELCRAISVAEHRPDVGSWMTEAHSSNSSSISISFISFSDKYVSCLIKKFIDLTTSGHQRSADIQIESCAGVLSWKGQTRHKNSLYLLDKCFNPLIFWCIVKTSVSIWLWKLGWFYCVGCSIHRLLIEIFILNWNKAIVGIAK